ncbi:conserved hypothetical protein [Deferribacter desulfuricans SSM1]|uniref:ComEC/Rec2-related protein domain-containing protein n=1 Tax=Deferribacter desulfuricans (strain DSM 14783 / JCM 11476 / NBRC 101012 / SSM1) TaxID=639282 RepID=D3P9R1_DEFDS|nr:ComEC/Rec2 family competence protein [Deferribacter desulfuricans]BAI81451.1 conserved hypothetical protein [Deferribacter desulfuricans SSM1]
MIKLSSLKFKTEIFLLFSIICGYFAHLFDIQQKNFYLFLYLIFIALGLRFFIKSKAYFIFLSLIVVFNIFLPKIQVITEAKNIYFDDAKRGVPKAELKGGEIIYGDKIIYIPVISKIIKKRNKVCRKLYILSAGNIKILQAALFGNRDYLSSDLKDKFIITGVYHLLAISGLHVGLIISIIYFLFSFLPVKFRYLIVSLSLIIFIILTGFKITVIRAATFAIIIFVALFLDVKTSLLKLALFLCGLFILLSPETLFDISFILSFSAVFGIILVVSSLKRYQFIAVPIAATAFTMPFILYFFGNFNYLGVINTFLVLPFIYILLVLGLFLPLGINFIIPSVEQIELLIEKLVSTLYNFSYSFFILHKIDVLLFIVLIMLIALFIKFRKIWILLLAFLIPFINMKQENIIIFPNMVRSKGFVDLREPTQVFFKGFYNDFKYKFLPIVARYGNKVFDNGEIFIYDGNNYYLKYRNFSIEKICINGNKPNCEIVYMTRSNSINTPLKDKLYIIYRNIVKSNNIIELYNTRCVTIINGSLSYDEDFCK